MLQSKKKEIIRIAQTIMYICLPQMCKKRIKLNVQYIFMSDLAQDTFKIFNSFFLLMRRMIKLVSVMALIIRG